MARATALIPAAGHGARVGADRNKVLLPLLDVPVLVWTLRIFESVPEVGGIVVVAAPSDRDEVLGLVDRYRVKGVLDVLPGGATRQESVLNGLQSEHCDGELVLIHDAARPLTRPQLMTEVLNAAAIRGAALAAVPVTDTILRGDSESSAIETVPRENLWQVQTPQAFRADLVREAYHRARAQGWEATDDASLVKRLGHSVAIVPGDRGNLKLTVSEDLALAEQLLRLRR